MIRILFSGSAIETLRIPAGTADSPRKPILARTVFDKGRYVNLRGGFQTDFSAGRRCYLLPNSPLYIYSLWGRQYAKNVVLADI